MLSHRITNPGSAASAERSCCAVSVAGLRFGSSAAAMRQGIVGNGRVSLPSEPCRMAAGTLGHGRPSVVANVIIRSRVERCDDDVSRGTVSWGCGMTKGTCPGVTTARGE
jgi:hypothetical protein